MPRARRPKLFCERQCEVIANVLGYDMPAGAINGPQAWSMHRRRDVFFCPDLFITDRWLLPVDTWTHSDSHSNNSTGMDPKSPPLPLLSQSEIFPFGLEPRVCGGQNVALMILRISLMCVTSILKLRTCEKRTSGRWTCRITL